MITLFAIHERNGLSASTARKFSMTGMLGRPILSMAYSSSLFSAVMIMNSVGTSARKAATSRTPCFRASPAVIA